MLPQTHLLSPTHPSDPLRPQRWSPLTRCPVGWRCPTRQPQGSEPVTGPVALQLRHLERAASSCEDTVVEGDFSRGGDRGEVSQTLSLQITQSPILGRGREWCGQRVIPCPQGDIEGEGRDTATLWTSVSTSVQWPSKEATVLTWPQANLSSYPALPLASV